MKTKLALGAVAAAIAVFSQGAFAQASAPANRADVKAGAQAKAVAPAGEKPTAAPSTTSDKSREQRKETVQRLFIEFLHRWPGAEVRADSLADSSARSRRPRGGRLPLGTSAYLINDSSANRSAACSRRRTSWQAVPSTMISAARPRVL